MTADLKKSPINAIVLHGTIGPGPDGSGQVKLQEATIQSPAFEAVASGTVQLDNVLTNSTLQIPVSVLLERSVAQRINMAGDTATNAAYVKLPDFFAIKGTLGDPKRNVNYLALAGAAAKGLGGKAGQAGSLIQGLGGLLGGNTNNPAPGSANNQPATNPSPVGDLLNNLLGHRKK